MKPLAAIFLGNSAVVCLMALCVPVTAQSKSAPNGDAKAYVQVVDKAITFLKNSQEADGGWSTTTNPGVTGIVLTGMLKTRPGDAGRSRGGQGAQVY